jgi:hypothetical protein
MMRLRCIAVLMTLSMTSVFARQDSISTLEQALKAQFQGKIVTFRHFYAASNLKFDTEGDLLGSPKEGPWTTCARVQVNQIDLNDQRFRISGRRLLLKYDQDNKYFFDIEEDQALSESQHQAIRGVQQFQMEISLASHTGRAEQLKSSLARILNPGTDDVNVLNACRIGFYDARFCLLESKKACRFSI